MTSKMPTLKVSSKEQIKVSKSVDRVIKPIFTLFTYGLHDAVNPIRPKVEHYYVNESGMLFITKPVEKVKENKNKNEVLEKINSDITFKLELEDEEKQARSKLVLPYLKTVKQTGSGEILYEPDELDDWDEEDPDDDLNI